MKNYSWLIVSLSCAVLVSTWACSKSSESAKEGGTLKTQVAASRLAISSSLAPLDLTNQTFGKASPDSLLSASYRVIDILLCEKASIEKGDACGEGKVMTLYDGGNGIGGGASDYDSFTSAEAAADTSSFIDFLSPTGRAKLAKSITYTDEDVAEYEGVVVHFYRPFKMSGSVTLGDGRTVYTKSSTTFEDNGKTGLDKTFQTVITSSTTAPAQEGVFFLPNGGKSFKLQKKLAITDDDVKNKTALKMVLAFDPDYMLKALAVDTSGSPGDWLEGQVDKTNNLKISADFLNFAPVMARESETIMRETYLLSMTTAVGTLTPHDIKLSVYYVKEDADKAVRAVTANWLYNSSSTSYINADPLGQVYTVTKTDDGKLDFLSSTGVKLLTGFERQTEKNKTFSVTSSYCGGASDTSSSTGCSIALSSKTYSAKLVSDTEVTAEGAITYATPTPTTAP